MPQFKVHRARILLLGEMSVFLSYSGTHLMEGNLLIQSTNLNVNFIDKGPHRKVQTKDVRPHDSAKLTHKVNHCSTVPVFSEYWCSEKMGNQKWANYLQTCKTEFISQLCFREAQTSEGNTCTL